MKMLIMALALSPGFAQAAFVCTSGDSGTVVAESEDGTVSVVRDGIQLATLECFTPEGDGQGGNVPHVTLSCRETRTPGYRFQMVSGGVVGISVRLTTPSQKLVNLNCRW